MASTKYNELIFFVNGKKNIVCNPDPEVTLLQYLRTELQLTGSKLGCGEGGCGACTVMVSVCPPDGNRIHHYSANACLLPVCSLHGAAVTTVEGIGSLRTKLHPVQERIASAHGTQCGFCTPGFVMSMYTLLRNSSTPSLHQLHTAFDGNLCRCTGYRPILQGFKCFTKEGCGKGANCCMNKSSCNISEKNSRLSEVYQNGIQNGILNNEDDHVENSYDPTQEPIFPPFLKLQGRKLHNQFLQFVGPRVTWYRPTSLAELLEIKRKNPNCKIVVGNTEIGIETRFKKQLYPVLVSTTHVKELNCIEQVDEGIKVGASVTLAALDNALKDAITSLPEETTRVFTAFVEMLRWFAGNQIRNVASLGGNIMTASPISDLNPLLLACGAVLQLVSQDGTLRTRKMDPSFFVSYRQTGVLPTEILLSVLIPFSKKNEYFFGYKQSTRKEDDIAIVNAGMRVELDTLGTVKDLALAFGGMAATTVMATKTMKQLIGCTWSDDLLRRACELLTSDLPLPPDSPGGVVEYRRTLTLSFFFKFYTAVLQRLHQEGVMTKVAVSCADASATKPLEREPLEAVQWFEAGSDAQWPEDALRLPVVHQSAYKHATGEAVYVDDMAPRRGELYLALVLSTKARAKLESVNPEEALGIPGVVDFVTHKDVPGEKFFGKDPTLPQVVGEGLDEVFASTEVLHQGQVIGAVVAETQVQAQRAAQAVKVKYIELEPVITIQDAIQKNSFFPFHPTICRGDVEVALSAAAHTLEGEMRVGAQEHFYLETQVTRACPGEDGELEVFCSTQALTQLQTSIGAVLKLPLSKITCRAKRLGGGFGGKETRPNALALPVAVAAMKLGRPVRCSLSRDEDMMMTGTRHPLLGRYKVGFTSKGILQALDVEYFLNAGASVDLSYDVLGRVVLDTDAAYLIPNLRVKGHVCKTNLPSNTAFRGFGHPQMLAVVETVVSQVAAYLNLPAEQVRLLNMYKKGDITHYNQRLEECNLRRCWDDVVQQSDYQQRRREVEQFNKENRWKKRGIAVTPVKFAPGTNSSFFYQGGALVNIYLDGTVTVAHGGVEMGQGLHTKTIQVASRVLQVPISKIRVDETSTATVPNAFASNASVSSDLYAAAVMDACNKLVEQLRPVKTQMPKVTWEELIKAAHQAKISLSATGHFVSNSDLDYDILTNTGRPYSYFTFGAACSVVEIDCLTGDHQVLSTDIVMDVGKSLSPAIDIGQIEGAFVQGYGLLMLEQYMVQPNGTLLTRGPGTYKIPSAGNIPQRFNVTLLRESGNPRALYSSKGVGEPPLLLAMSVLMAVRHAITAARMDAGLSPLFPLDTPATPARIRMACADHFTRMIETTKTENNIKPWFVDL
ncbi:xanthine dehydrogenase/oxidase-like [Pomacea canaliculata]|uniref:xanthine dehydrogenase/oxidase-like n=1 Tax=Pomacea canaliculata TaxID=400727 RepID=UPI000D73327A|nr:xanthine dehydrogenase/oxidase-like [Pomacea canaliculata]